MGSAQTSPQEPTVPVAVQIVLVIAVIGYVIARQLQGEPLRGKRVVLLPVILAVIGLSDLGDAHSARPVDLVLLIAGGLIAAGIGVGQGALMHLESRDGGLWGRMPLVSLWLWLALIVSRLLLTGLAHVLNAQVAAGGATILLMLGINRLAQAGVIVLRATAAGIPFSPEKDGTPFLAQLTDRDASRSREPQSREPRLRSRGSRR
jgi:hypothetical protein